MTTGRASFGERYLSESFKPPIAHGDVRRLALEGGGGKGNAYLGALFALDQLGVLDNLDTVAGSSAGAISSLALALGMRPRDIYAFMTTTDFSKFFDPESDAIPTVGRPYEHPSSADRAQRALVTTGWRTQLTGIQGLGLLATGLKFALQRSGEVLARTILEGLFLAEDITYAIAALQHGPGAGPPPSRSAANVPAEPDSMVGKVVQQLLRSLPEYMTSLSLDMGLLSGEAARDRFADLIAERLANTDLTTGVSRPGASVDGRSVTFAQLDEFCAVNRYPRLRVTGSELCSLKSVIFSGKTTPQFPVADAIRISMGLPFVYKPYTLRKSGSGLPPCGVYVDGGVFSNLPLLAYSDSEATAALGMRLEIDSPSRIDGFLGFAGQLAKASILAGESSITLERSERTVRLDTEPLGLFDFSAQKDLLSTVSARAHLTTMLFFGQGADYTPVDLATGQPLPKERARAVTQEVWKDLRASVDRRVKASGCVFGGEEPK